MPTTAATTCKYGHPYVPGSYEWRTNKGTGGRYTYCLVCPKDLTKRLAQKPARTNPADCCSRGHAWTPETTQWVERPSDGKKYRWCKICGKARGQATAEGLSGDALVVRTDELCAEWEHAKRANTARTSKAMLLLHRLWTKAVGTENYVKDEWKALEAAILALE